MLRRFLVIDLFIIAFMSLFSGLMDAYCFLYRDGTLCFIQTGNLIRTVIYYAKGQADSATYSLIIFLVFLIFCFLYYLFVEFLKSKKIGFRNLSLFICMIMVIPSVVFKFNENSNLYYGNIISGCCLSVLGAILVIVFKEVNFGKDHTITFNVAMMTGNSRTMMIAFAQYFKNKNKIRLGESLCILSLMITFCLGVLFCTLIDTYVENQNWHFYSIFIFVYGVLIILFIMTTFRKEWIKNYAKMEYTKMKSKKKKQVIDS